MIKIFTLVNQITKAKGYENDVANIINYNAVEDKTMSEDEYLFYQYQNLINIRKAIINYISWKE